ncbi:MAG: virulence factor [Legionellales bacterium RIFCSPHIGHO2_12_FULL_42_9]|nr:MAG: virulence factor [Legionellales bacterium RIFCSPHIGHO2_12_FULL_42_9]
MVAKEIEDFEKLAEEARRYSVLMESDPVVLIERLYQLWWHWADFSLFIIQPTIEVIVPPIIIPPASLPDSNELEFVYPIHDYGYKLMTSKATDMFIAGMSMCKLYYTIEKMIFLLIERLKSGGVSTEMEVQVAFGGHELPQRKAFESVINLNYNVIVTNFEPGNWGERYLEVVKFLSDRGYGYPPETPRDNYRQSRSSVPGMKRS